MIDGLAPINLNKEVQVWLFAKPGGAMRKAIIEYVESECERLGTTVYAYLGAVGKPEELEAFLAVYGCWCSFPGSPGPCNCFGRETWDESFVLAFHRRPKSRLTSGERRELERLRDLT